MSDYISSLPSDEIPLNVQEIKLLDAVLQDSQKSNIQSLFQDLKQPFIYGLVFLILNTNQISDFIENLIPYAAKSNLSLLFVKTALFIVAVYILNNLSNK
jgi:cadmium resistance protein CadD (predicted permease)